MYDPNNITFTKTYKNVPAMKNLATQLDFLGRGFKGQMLDQLIMAAAKLAAHDPKTVQKLANGDFILKTI